MYADSIVGEVYALRISNSSGYFYVGVTKYTARERLLAHIGQVNDGSHSNKRFAQSVGEAGTENIVLEVLERPLLVDRWDCEERWIKKLLREGHPLVNRIHNQIHFDSSGRTIEESREIMRRFLNNPPGPSSEKLRLIYELVYELVNNVYRSYDIYLEMLANGEIEADR